ncbi:hypothetical protein DMB44_09100 [Thermoplasma sp. Kam2015]|nr:hypothetical protein DMB44_09100 [Thermoplasma sp. Kam2015]
MPIHLDFNETKMQDASAKSYKSKPQAGNGIFQPKTRLCYRYKGRLLTVEVNKDDSIRLLDGSIH